MYSYRTITRALWWSAFELQKYPQMLIPLRQEDISWPPAAPHILSRRQSLPTGPGC